MTTPEANRSCLIKRDLQRDPLISVIWASCKQLLSAATSRDKLSYIYELSHLAFPLCSSLIPLWQTHPCYSHSLILFRSIIPLCPRSLHRHLRTLMVSITSVRPDRGQVDEP